MKIGLSSKLFYDNSDDETLFSRISLTEEQIKDAIEKKNKLLEFIKPKLSNSLEVPVKHWLQGSYKNHTLIRPVRKDEEFDIDVGIYILCNAENKGLGALYCKNLHRENLKLFVLIRPEAKLEEIKTNCERLIYPTSFHIDIPFYYYDGEIDVCKLASQKNEWIDSDPKAFQDWFDESVEDLSANKLAQLRRIIKYLKVWTSLKKYKYGISIPSIAITVLVVNNYYFSEFDDESFIETAVSIVDYILENRHIDNPTQGGDLFGFTDDEYRIVKKKANALKDTCELISQSEYSLEQYILWSEIFEHMFPPFIERMCGISKNTNLPAITIPPIIRVIHLDESKKVISTHVTNEIKAYRYEGLYFSVDNPNDYGSIAKVHWIVRNQDNEAKRVNDLGHMCVQSINEERYEWCSYIGTHYMECLIFDDRKIKGISAVRVKIINSSRPVRNPPIREYYKGR